jgi:uncharacterized protein
MAERKIREIIKYLRELLEEKNLKVNKIILFGSYETKNHKKDSDIDIAVISETFNGKGIFARVKIMGDVEWKLMEKYLVPLDIVTMSPQDFEKGNSLVSRYAKAGKVIYAS